MRVGKRTEGLVLLPFAAIEGRPAGGERWQFTVRETDPKTALRSHRARSSDPTPARWAMEDPVGFAAGDAHLHRYVGHGSTEAGGGPERSPS